MQVYSEDVNLHPGNRTGGAPMQSRAATCSLLIASERSFLIAAMVVESLYRKLRQDTEPNFSVSS